MLPNGKVIVGGGFSNYNGTPRGGICLLNADGSLDASFSTGNGGYSLVYALAPQPDGKVLVVVDSFYYGSYQNLICRINNDGTLDASFSTGRGLDDRVYALALQPDRKILVGGDFTSYNGTATNKICRLFENGNLDAFGLIGTGLNDSPYALVLQPDGKVLVGGYFTSYNDIKTNYLARLFAFEAPVAFKQVSSAVLALYPNPAQTHITLQTDMPMHYKLVSTTGVVWQEGLAQPGGNLSVAGLPQGVYSVLLTSGQAVVVKRFVKE